jgi:hypothetical protein
MRLARPFAVASIATVATTVTAALFGVLLWASALAQSGDANPTPTPMPEEPEPSAYLTLDMAAGFALDPFLVSLNGGGERDAATFDADCVGYVNDQPVMTTHWEGAVDELRVFFYSDSDSTLVIQQPDGSFVCADDAADNVLDPEITFTAPMTGAYKLWIGSFDENQLIPGLLVITARPDFGLAEFDPSTLVRRAPIEPEVDMAETSGPAIAAKEIVTTAEVISTDAVITTATTVTASLVASGTVPSFEVSGDDAVCGGMIGDVPDFIVDVPEGIELLRIMFEAEQDSSLVVVHGEEGSFCADDSADLTNANPVLDIEAPEAGYYGIYVGRFNEDEPVGGTLTVTTDPTLEPAILAPATSVQQ